jgi:hypothetical protein
MPRGNDPEEAASELRARYPDSGNVQDLLRASRVGQSATLQAAQLKPKDEEESAKLDLDKVADKVPGEGEVLDASVRGDHVIYAVQRPNGFVHKGVLERGKGGALKAVEEEGDESEMAALADEAKEREEALEKAEKQGDPVVGSRATPAKSAAEKAQEED